MHNTRLLCAARHCAIRNRHRDTCPDTEQCWGCLPRWAADGLHLCDVEVRRLGEDAAKAAQLHTALASVIIRTGGGQGEKTSGSATGAPVPDDEVVAYRSKIRGMLLAAVRLITEERGVHWPAVRYVHRLPDGVEGPAEIRHRRTEELPAAARFIGKHAEWLAAHRYAAAISQELRGVAGDGRIWALAYPAGANRIYVGDCPAVITEDDGAETICGARLYQYPDQPLIGCDGCGVQDTIEQWRRWIVGDAGQEADAYLIASHLSTTWMRPVGPDTVKRWGQRGHLDPVLEPDGAGGERVKRDARNRTQYRMEQAVEYASDLWGPPAARVRTTRSGDVA